MDTLEKPKILKDLKQAWAVDDHVMVLRAAGAKKTKGGLALPASMIRDNICSYGRVLAVGPKCERTGPDDFVLFDEPEARAIEIRTEVGEFELVFVREPQIFGGWSKELVLALGVDYPTTSSPDMLSVFAEACRNAQRPGGRAA